ncbi:MAG: hypothetical protein CSA38_01165 [Flavobacteriales bacterium]|nr:MAG: hypothetical protein CSA38_01165 [Flavobacteriales bacterium]
MDRIKNYRIIFSGLKDGIHEFEFEVKEAFFSFFDTEQEFENPNIKVNAKLEKRTTFLELWLDIKGTVELTCDISNENFDYTIESSTKYIIKFGNEYDDTHEEIIVIPKEDYYFDTSQLIYENILLAIPMKKISPNISDEDLSIVEQYSLQEEPEEEKDEESIDPRWEALKKLKK